VTPAAYQQTRFFDLKHPFLYRPEFPEWNGHCFWNSHVAVGRFCGEVAVTMRCFPTEYADKVVEFTSGFPRCHGGPIAIDDPGSLGIEDLADQHTAWPGPIPDGDRHLYWACGITPSRVAIEARLPWMVVHTPWNALVTDLHTLDLFEG
jgi:uncharacterized protein YcsI (UPF0317 family)